MVDTGITHFIDLVGDHYMRFEDLNWFDVERYLKTDQR